MNAIDSPQTVRSAHTVLVLWTTLGLLLVALAGVAVYKVWPILHPQGAILAPMDPACDLRAAPCTGRFPGGGTVRFGIEPRTLPPVSPLRIAVDLEGIAATMVEVDFAGTDMNMGYNRVTLSPTGAGRYRGQGMLPVCVRSRMGWEAKVLIQRDGKLWIAPFRFETDSAAR